MSVGTCPASNAICMLAFGNGIGARPRGTNEALIEFHRSVSIAPRPTATLFEREVENVSRPLPLKCRATKVDVQLLAVDGRRQLVLHVEKCLASHLLRELLQLLAIQLGPVLVLDGFVDKLVGRLRRWTSSPASGYRHRRPSSTSAAARATAHRRWPPASRTPA